VSPKEQEVNATIAEQAKQGVKIENIEKTCEEIRDCLLGNGKPGLVLRTDRLEQKDKVRAKMFWLVFTTLGAVAAKVLADTLGISF
jgi:hypothetical protein